MLETYLQEKDQDVNVLRQVFRSVKSNIDTAANVKTGDTRMTPSRTLDVAVTTISGKL
jgi:hypothetical protein